MGGGGQVYSATPRGAATEGAGDHTHFFQLIHVGKFEVQKVSGLL